MKPAVLLLVIALFVAGVFFVAKMNGTPATASAESLKEAAKATVAPQAVQPDEPIQIATLGNGCFWCTEAVFEEIPGVISAVSGYSGGHVENPTYEQVCGKKTGHAEVVQIKYDQTKVSFEKLLQAFFLSHDPTTLNRQGNDVGPQYRSAIFFHNDYQKQVAEETIKNLTDVQAFDFPIVTEVTEFTNFFAAEDYHQQYFELNGSQPYCNFVIKPKLEKFKKAFKELEN